MNKGENKMKKIKSIFCVLVALALISPEYASGALSSNNPNSTVDKLSSVMGMSGVMLLTPGITLTLMNRKKPTLIASSIAGGLIQGALILFVSSAVFGSEADREGIFTGDPKNLDLVLLSQNIVEFKGQEERKLQLEDKNLAESYHYINGECDVELTLDTTTTNISDEEQKEIQIDAYIERGCPYEFILVDNTYDVGTLLHDGMITEHNADIAKKQLQDAINKGQYKIVPILL